MVETRGYRHLCEIASGGMGRVFVAVRRGDPDQQLFAVKRLHPHLQDDPRARRSFHGESALAKNLEHPNVLRVHGCGEDADGPYLAMEYIDGCSLGELSTAVKRADEDYPLQVCLDIAQQLARGLDAIHQHHEQNVVHRDVSPQNVLVDYSGRVRIADFGIAKVLHDEGRIETSSGVLKGKVGYMSPEQLRFEGADHRADLFALGVVLWELLAGRRLYFGSDGSEGARRILHEPPPDIGDDREDVPAELVQLLFELLAKDPSARPASAAIVAERLREQLEAQESVEGRVDLGNYVDSFFAPQRETRRSNIATALARSVVFDQAEAHFGDQATAKPKRRWRVKGAAITATLDYLERSYGEAGYQKVLSLLSPEVGELLSGPVLVSSWFDGSVMLELTEVAQRLFGEDEGPSLGFRIGISSANYAFGPGGPYEVFRMRGLREGIAPFLDTSGEIYRLYYDVGAWAVEHLGTGICRIRVSRGRVFPNAIVERILGYFQRGFELIGALQVQVHAEHEGEDLVIHGRWREP